VISRNAHPASAEFWLAGIRNQVFSVAVFYPAFQPYPTPSMDGDEEARCVIVVDENGPKFTKPL